jgi:hypothetical protein
MNKITQNENNETRVTKHGDIEYVWYECGLPVNFTGYEFRCEYCKKIPVKHGVITELEYLQIRDHLEAFPAKEIYFCTKRCEKKYKKALSRIEKAVLSRMEAKKV